MFSCLAARRGAPRALSLWEERAAARLDERERERERERDAGGAGARVRTTTAATARARARSESAPPPPPAADPARAPPPVRARGAGGRVRADPRARARRVAVTLVGNKCDRGPSAPSARTRGGARLTVARRPLLRGARARAAAARPRARLSRPPRARRGRAPPASRDRAPPDTPLSLSLPLPVPSPPFRRRRRRRSMTSTSGRATSPQRAPSSRSGCSGRLRGSIADATPSRDRRRARPGLYSGRAIG